MYSAKHDAKLQTQITREDKAALSKQYLIGNIRLFQSCKVLLWWPQ